MSYLYRSGLGLRNRAESGSLSFDLLPRPETHVTIATILDETPFPVLSEEGKHLEYDTRRNWDVMWIVDPLDGTKEFIKRNGEFTVNIALVKAGVPIIGVIYLPVKKELYICRSRKSDDRTR